MTQSTARTLGEFYASKFDKAVKTMCKTGMAEEIAEDCVEDAMELIVTKLEEGTLLPDMKVLTAFLNTCIHNKEHEVFRKNQQLHQNVSIDDDDFDDEHSTLFHDVDNVIRLDDDYQHCMLSNLDRLDAALDKLSPKSQALIRGHYFDAKTMSELAEELHLANANVAKSSKLRAMQELRDIFFALAA